MIQMKPYVKVELTFIALDSNGLLSQANNGEIRERMEKTIEMEAPIRRSLLYKRVINSFGLVKVGSRISPLFDSIAQALDYPTTEDSDGETVFHNGEVVFHKEEKEDFFRPSPDPEDRYSYQIPSSEAASCLIYIISSSDKNSMTKSQLYRDFIKTMGWEKSGGAIEKLFSSALSDPRIKRSGNGRFIK